MPSVITEGRHPSDWLKSYASSSQYSTEQGLLVAGSGVVQTGTVLGRVTATGKFKPVTAAATDGSQTAAGILFRTAEAATADAKIVVVVREAVVVAQSLLYGADIDTPAKRATVQAQLRALNPPILAREGA